MIRDLADLKKAIGRRLERARERLSKIEDDEFLDREFIRGCISELCVMQDLILSLMNQPPNPPH